MLDIEKIKQAALEYKAAHEIQMTVNPSAVIELIEKLEAADKDADRLNFLDENLAKNMGWSCGVAPFGNIGMQSVLCSKKTSREAIDAAMKEQSK